MHRTTAVFAIFIAALLGAGVYMGVALSRLPKLETFKLLNILGLTLDLLGLLVLSEIVLSSERWKAFVIKWVAGVLLWGQTVVPLGAALGAEVLGVGPSTSRAAGFFFALFAYSLVPLAVLDHAVFYPGRFSVADKTQRTRRFGLLLIASGVLVQLIAAFQDLYG